MSRILPVGALGEAADDLCVEKTGKTEETAEKGKFRLTG